jgi:HIV Tat-specific factor 1
MNNRFFGGRTVSAFPADGSKKYRKSGAADHTEAVLAGTGLEDEEEQEGEEEKKRKEEERLRKYAEWLEKGGEE